MCKFNFGLFSSMYNILVFAFNRVPRFNLLSFEVMFHIKSRAAVAATTPPFYSYKIMKCREPTDSMS